MSVVQQTSDPGPHLDGLQRVSITSLQSSSSMLNKYVTGEIQTRGPVMTKGRHPVMKLVLQESPTALINVYMVADFAVGMDKFHAGDTLYISNSVLERSHTYLSDNRHECHIMVDIKRSHPLIWVKPKPVPASDTSGAQTAPGTTSGAPQTVSALQVTPAKGPGPSHGASPSTNGAITPGRYTPGKDTPQKGPDVVQVSAVGALSPAKTIHTYNYIPLKDIKESYKLDVYGVIKFFKPPYKTKGPDYCMVVTIVDPTCEEGLKCVIFQPDIKLLPQVKSAGDIVRFHRLKVQQYKGDFQGGKGPGFSCLVVDGRPGTPIEPRACTENFTFTDQDKKKVQELRDWAHQVVVSEGTNWTLSQVVSREYFNLTCQVVAMATIPSENCVLIKVWDGTKYKWPIRTLDVSQVTVQWDQELAKQAEGMMVDVALYDDHMKTGMQLKPGQFVRLYNLHAAPYTPPNVAATSTTAATSSATVANLGASMIELVLHRGTAYGRGLAVMKDWEDDIRQIKKRMEDLRRNQPLIQAPPPPCATQSINQASSASPRLSQDLEELDEEDVAMLDAVSETGGNSLDLDQDLRCMERPGAVITDHHDVAVSSIDSMLLHPPVYRLKAVVEEYFPSAVADFIHLFCPKCRMSCRLPGARNGVSSPSTAKSNPGVMTRQARKRRAAEEQPSSSLGEGSGTSRKNTRSRSARANDPAGAPRGSRAGQEQRVEFVDLGQVSKETSSALVYVKDLTVKQSLSLIQEGMRLVRQPKVTLSAVQRRGRPPPPGMLLYKCPMCSPTQRPDEGAVLLQYRYWLKLTLRDGSGRVEAVLQGKEAELFFGVPPCNLNKTPKSRDALFELMNELCPTPGEGWENGEELPGIECCLEPHISTREGERVVAYHIRDTKLALGVH